MSIGVEQPTTEALVPVGMQSFFSRWWKLQSAARKDDIRMLVYRGQLEFVNGGWVQHDEAAAHYVAMIDQTTLGHQ